MRIISIVMFLSVAVQLLYGGVNYKQFFTDKTLRIDYYHTGTKGQEQFSFDQACLEGQWPGSRVHLEDTLNMGEYIARVYDVATGSLIFSRGYSTMFNEWQTTDEAHQGVYRTFSESVRLPFPLKPIQFTIARRDKRMVFHELFSALIDPNDRAQIRKEKQDLPFRVSSLVKSGDPSEKVDIVIIGDGYARSDIQTFREKARELNDAMFDTQPFKSRKNDFNVWVVEAISEESGIDIPDLDEWKNNILGSRYSSFGSARYVLTEENKKLRDVAALAPYDFICILINGKRYGGGGIYNLYATTYTGEEVRGQEWQMKYVYVHEFGHSFGGLGDEYYSSSTSYNDFYPQGVEPWEPNITATPTKDGIKWKSFLTPGVEVPTSWEKTPYDSLEALRGKLDRLAPDYYEKREPLYQSEMAILKGSHYAGVVGAFEGAGYANRGLYRPSVDCRMFSLSLVDFDPVCSAAIKRVIDFYAK